MIHTLQDLNIVPASKLAGSLTILVFKFHNIEPMLSIAGNSDAASGYS